MEFLEDKIQNGLPYMPFEVGYLPEAIIVKAEKELGETEEVRTRTLNELRKLIESDPNMKAFKDDLYLLQFLRPHKFSVERAFQQMLTSYKEKKRCGYLFDKSDPERLRRTYGLKTIFCLPYRDEDGAVVFIVKLSSWDPDVSTADDFVSALTCIVLMCSGDPMTQVCGIRVLIDVGGLRLKHIRALAPSCMSIIGNALKNTLAARWVGIHVCHESTILPVAWTISKLFLSKKIKNRVHFHGDRLPELQKFIPKAILPAEFGGDYTEDVASWFNSVVEKFLDRYEELCLRVGYR